MSRYIIKAKGTDTVTNQAQAIELGIGAIFPAITDFTRSHDWLECDGRAISRTKYPELFLVLATRFGIGDGTETFNLPDLRGPQVRH